MRYEEMEVELLNEFPELGSLDVIWEKEVFAHFGLLFMGIGLLEHSLINAVMLTNAASDFARNKGSTGSWPELVDRHFDLATRQTFGNLAKSIATRKGFEALQGELGKVKKLRDYFAHHFMRQDSDLMSQRQGCILLIFRLQEARKQLKAVEHGLDEATQEFFTKIGLPKPDATDVAAHVSEIKLKVEADITDRVAEVGWKRNAL
jgi:hypothetical protein